MTGVKLPAAFTNISGPWLTIHDIDLWTLLLLAMYVRITGAFYHLTSLSHACRVTVAENATVDLICQYQEGFMTSPTQGVVYSCSDQKVVWQRADYHLVTNISDTSKYGVWEAVPGWKMDEDKRVSLFRIRNLQAEDMGLYQCRILCRKTDGQIHVSHHMADICMLQGHPDYSVCATHSLDNKCSLSHKNGVCDPECDNEENLYDGFECASEEAECRSTDADADDCQKSFADGVCDVSCNEAWCAWDGGDCIDRPLSFADDIVVLTLAKWYETSGKVVDVKSLGRTLSLLLRTIVRVMPSDWRGFSHRDVAAGREASWHRPDRRGHDSARRIYLKIDNTMCRRRCFSNAKYAARFIDLALRTGWQPGIPISAIGVLSRTVNRCSLENNTLLHIDLPVSAQEKTNPNIYSYTYAETKETSPPTWLLIIAITGGLLIIVLIIVIVVIILRIRKLSKDERHRMTRDLDRIHDKNGAQGTDV